MEGEGQWGNERRELLSCGIVGTADAAKSLRATGIPQKTDSTENPARGRPERRPTIKTEAGLPISAAYPAFLISKFLLRPAKPALGHLFRCPENSSAPGWIPGIRPYTAHCLCTSGKPSEPDRVFPGTGPATADCIYYLYKRGALGGEVLRGGRLGGGGLFQEAPSLRGLIFLLKLPQRLSTSAQISSISRSGSRHQSMLQMRLMCHPRDSRYFWRW